MKRDKKTYSIFQLSSAVLMIVALLWLTISAPFVFASQQYADRQGKVTSAPCPISSNDEETANPFGNNTEEKAPSGTSFSEEYLHDHHTTDHFFSIALPFHKCENADTYHAYHGELLVPPPNLA
jgi:hypothetical protein